MRAQPSVVSAIPQPSFTPCDNFQRVHSIPSSLYVMKKLNGIYSAVTHEYSIGDCPPAKSHVAWIYGGEIESDQSNSPVQGDDWISGEGRVLDLFYLKFTKAFGTPITSSRRTS